MNCKHEWIRVEGNFGKAGTLVMTACYKCMKSTGEVDIEEELAAAKAMIENMKCCGNCEYWGISHAEAPYLYCRHIAGGKTTASRNCVCSKWKESQYTRIYLAELKGG
jgi:hypothetical protein